MAAYVAGRLVQAIPVLFVASACVFFILRVVPGDPVAELVGDQASPERAAEVRTQLGLDGTLPEQYVHWVGAALRGDLGTSFRSGVPVSRLLSLALPPTLELAAVTFPLALVVGIPFGIIAGLRPRSRWDNLLSAYTVIAVGVPGFLLGIFLIWAFSIELQFLPSSGRVSLISDPVSSLRHLALPAVSLSAGMAAVVARTTRTSIAQVARTDYVRTARAKGLSERTVAMRHVLRNALAPVVTVASLQAGHLLAGAVVVERVFTRPGLGSTMVGAIQNHDYMVVQGALLVLVFVYVGINLAADIAYGIIDPRLRAA